MYGSLTKLSFNVKAQRARLVALAVGATTSAIVYFLYDWFHITFLTILGIDAPLDDAFGTLLIILKAAAWQHRMSLVPFRDTPLAVADQQKSAVRQYQALHTAAHDVNIQLAKVPDRQPAHTPEHKYCHHPKRRCPYWVVEHLNIIDHTITDLNDSCASE